MKTVLGIRTNHSVKHLKERIEYYTKALKEFPKYHMIISEDLEEATLNLKEANERNYIGEDETGAKAYIVESILWVEGKPSGWRVVVEELTSNSKREVVYDGSTNWRGTITFY